MKAMFPVYNPSKTIMLSPNELEYVSSDKKSSYNLINKGDTSKELGVVLDFKKHMIDFDSSIWPL